MDKITAEYVKHALKLIRVGNGLQLGATSAMRVLARQLRKLLAGEDLSTLGIVKLRKIIAASDQIVFDVLENIAADHIDAATKLISMESDWAAKIGQYETEASDTAIARAAADFTVFGNTIDDHMAVIGQRLSNQVEAQIRLGASAGQSDVDIIQRIIGNGTRGGVMEQARSNVRAIADSAVHSAADTGRRIAMAAAGVGGVQWMAILDMDVCPDCAERDGKCWLIDGTPITDAPEWIPVPIHPRCRCISMPLSGDEEQITKYAGKTPDNFGKFLDTMSEAEQNDVLGTGRAAIWRDGKMSLNELVGQDGLFKTLTELEQELKQ
jgi:SPP1 gp7 family putative phage head morphogenesis protein